MVTNNDGYCTLGITQVGFCRTQSIDDGHVISDASSRYCSDTVVALCSAAQPQRTLKILDLFDFLGPQISSQITSHGKSLEIWIPPHPQLPVQPNKRYSLFASCAVLSCLIFSCSFLSCSASAQHGIVGNLALFIAIVLEINHCKSRQVYSILYIYTHMYSSMLIAICTRIVSLYRDTNWLRMGKTIT